jgi:coenzyme F420-reducing hydrogenase beta subunit
MELDEYGEYRYVGESIKSLNLTTLSAMSDDSPDESVVSKGLFEKTPSIKHDNVIGHYLDLYAGYVAEGEYRKNGSSGGFGTWIAVPAHAASVAVTVMVESAMVRIAITSFRFEFAEPV